MSIPQICPNCENHINMTHKPGCCYGAPEYAHIGWPDISSGTVAESYRGLGGGYNPPTHTNSATMEELSKDGFVDSASAIRRLLAYLRDEPEPSDANVAPEEMSDMGKVLCRLNAKANELRKEAAGMYNVEARAKRNFAADVLDSLVEEIA